MVSSWQSLLSSTLSQGSSDYEENSINGIVTVMKELHLSLDEVKRLPLPTYIYVLNFLKDRYERENAELQRVKAN